MRKTTQTKTLVVVSILRMPVVAIGGTAIFCIVVPSAAANNTATAFLPDAPIPKDNITVAEMKVLKIKKSVRRYASEQWFSAQ